MMDSIRLPLETALSGGVLVITNCDPPWNRMSFAYMDEVERVLTSAANDRNVRAIVFTSAGIENFSVGMDLKMLREMLTLPDGVEQFDILLEQRRRILRTIETMRKPSVVTMFGNCLGGGLELPLACHFRLAADQDAKIGLPEIELGIMPAWGGTARLTRCIGRSRAIEMMLNGRTVDGEEALRIGLVHSIHPINELKDAAILLAQELATRPPLAVAGILACAVEYGDAPLDAALDEERKHVLACARSQDTAEGLSAFVEKRKPRFIGA